MNSKMLLRILSRKRTHQLTELNQMILETIIRTMEDLLPADMMITSIS
jgi:hypothetical protein